MRGFKRFLSIMMLAVVVGLGTPAAALAEGSTETPSLSVTGSVDAEADPTDNTAGASIYGTTETPSLLNVITVYLSAVM